MSLTAIAIYAPGDFITSAWANILRTNFGVLDARTGGDPGAAGKLSRSDGATSSAWTPMNALTDDIATSGSLSAGGTGQFSGTVSMFGQLLVVGPATFGSAISPAQYLGGSTVNGVPSFLGISVGAQGVYISGPGGVNVVGGGGVASSGPVSGTTGQFSGNLGTGGNLGVSGVGTFSQPVAALRFLANVADALTAPFSAHPNQAGVECPNLRAASATVAVSANTANLAANANQLGGVSASVTAGPSRIPMTDSTGKLDAWITPAVAGATVPSGAIVAFDALVSLTAAGSGWTRHTAANGRLLVGDGTTFGQVFAQAGSYGASWGHDHTTPAHSHSGATLSVSGTTGQASASGGTVSGTPPPSFGTATHTHDQGTLDVGGSTATDGASTAGSTTWLPAMLGVVWGRKL